MTTRNTVNVIEGTVTVVEVITAGPQGALGGGGGAGTDLSWDAATRTVASSTGTDAVLTEATTALPGLMSAADKALVNRAETVPVAVRNNSGAAIPKGSAVYVVNTSGTTITVALADASTEATAAQTLGLAQDAISNNTNGTVIAVGELTGLDTSALTEGAIIWLSETTGALTTTRPTQPAHGVSLGYCVKSGPGASGIVYVKVDNGQELEELHDVLITSATTDQALMKAADGLWKNKTITPALIGAATAAQGALADSAVQPAALSSYLTNAAAATTYQPLDADLTAIAALSTTTFGRSLLTQADAAAARATIGGAASGAIGSSGLTMTAGILARETGTGAPQIYSLGSGLAIVGGALVVTAGGTGTVTSVGLSLPSIFSSVTGSPVTTSGTLAATLAAQAANLVFAGPSSGADATPTFRALATADLPSIIAPSAELTLPLNAPGSPTVRDIYAVANTIRYRDSSNAERLLLNATDNLANLSNTTTARSNIGAAASGAIGSSGLTMATARLLGRTTASTGAPEEITVGSGLSLSAGTLTATGGGGGVTFSVYATGNYIQPVQGALSAGAAMVANNIYLYPFFVWRTMTVDNLGARVTTLAAGSSVQLAIYNSTANGVPTTLLANTVGISSGSTGPINNNVTAFTLNAGQLYWMAMNSDGTPTMMGIGSTSNYYTTVFGSSVLADVSSGSGASIGRTIGQTYNAWPTDLTSAGTTIDTNRRGGLVWLRVATLS